MSSRYPQLNDRDWLRERYESGDTTYDIAATVGCDPSTVGYALVRHGIELRSGGGRPYTLRYPQLGDEAWLREHYEVQGMSTSEVAKVVGCGSPTTVLTALIDHGIERRPQSPGGQPTSKLYPQLSDRAWLRDLYVTRRLTTTEIALKVGCSSKTVSHALRKHKIVARKPGTRYPQLTDYKFLYREYVTRKRNMADIALDLGCSESAVLFHLARHGIPRRLPVSERNKLKAADRDQLAEALSRHLSSRGTRRSAISGPVRGTQPRISPRRAAEG